MHISIHTHTHTHTRKGIVWEMKWSESHSVESDSLWLYNLWNSPGQNTGVGSLSLLQGMFPTQGWNPGLLHCRRILFTSWAIREAHDKPSINIMLVLTSCFWEAEKSFSHIQVRKETNPIMATPIQKNQISDICQIFDTKWEYTINSNQAFPSVNILLSQ